MKGEYRDAQSKQEIDSILGEEVSNDCLIWQNIDGERVVYKIKKLQKSEDGSIVEFRIINYNQDFVKDDPVYVKLAYRGTMFRSTIHALGKSKISLKYPKPLDVKTIELRKFPRISFDPNKECFVTLSFRNFSVGQDDYELNFQLLDISQNGLCLIVSTQNKSLMQDYSYDLYLTHLSNTEISTPIELEKKYIEPFRYRKNGKSVFSLRVGMKLLKKLDKDTMDNFVKENF